MKYQLTDEDVALLKRMQRHLHGSEDFGFAPAVYISPAQRLRNQADAIEAQDKDVRAYQELMAKL